MTKISRRKFIGASALASGSMLIPKFLKAFETNAAFGLAGENVLVIVQLSGGNDGLNTIIPYRNDIYFQSRPTIAVEASKVLKLNDDLGFNPAMESIRKIYDDGIMCIINSVGYPNPDHSHFRSMDIWHTASGSDRFLDSGWVGRYLDASCPDCASHKAIEVDDTLSLAMKGEKVNGIAMKEPQKLYMTTKDKYFSEAANAIRGDSDNLDYLYKVMRETVSSADYIYKTSKIYKSSETYPDTEFSKNLRTIAGLIISNANTKVYYVSLSGFDTHIRQKTEQERLLKILSDGLLSFTNDLKKNNRLQNTMIITFSEFGRRVKQNASNGTDHGTANNVMIINGSLKKKGFFNASPNLTSLNVGDLKYQIDFRNIYSTLLKKWLGANDETILRSKFEQLDFV